MGGLELKKNNNKTQLFLSTVYYGVINEIHNEIFSQLRSGGHIGFIRGHLAFIRGHIGFIRSHIGFIRGHLGFGFFWFEMIFIRLNLKTIVCKHFNLFKMHCGG